MSRFDALETEDLVRLAQVGSLDAFDVLVRRFRPAVELVAAQEAGCRALAQDVAQDALLQAFRSVHQLRDASRFPAWLCTVTRHRARRAARRSGRARAVEATELDTLVRASSIEPSDDPAARLVREEAARRVQEALGALGPDHQTAMLLHYLEGWSAPRIAEFLAVPLTTVKWRLHRGRELLRARLMEGQEGTDGQ